MSERTLVLIKPDAVAKGHLGTILSRYEDAGLTVERLELRQMDQALAAEHYAEHVERDYYPTLKQFMTSGPLVAAILVGDDAIARVRELNGATDPAKAAPGTIRADFAETMQRNAVHASDAPESAAREMAIWFD